MPYIYIYPQFVPETWILFDGRSKELRKGAAEQNKVLIHMMETMEQRAPKAKEVKPEVEKIKFPLECVRSRRQPTEEERVLRVG